MNASGTGPIGLLPRYRFADDSKHIKDGARLQGILQRMTKSPDRVLSRVQIMELGEEEY